MFVIVWDSLHDLNGTTGTDMDIYSSRSLDFGVTWEAPVSVNNASTDAGRDETAAIAGNGVDVFVVVWNSQDTVGGQLGTDNDILLSRSTDFGIT